VNDTTSAKVAVRSLREAGAGLSEGIDRVFFETSATTSFADDGARAVFRERWLGRYLTHYGDWFYVAVSETGGVVGYLAGCLDDPAQTPLFSDLDYFSAWSDLTARYPAHLHVNVGTGWKGKGIGARLVTAFLEKASAAGAPGVHVVTGRGMRNVRFYEAQGFREAGALRNNGRDLVFFGRALPF
jgi:GNAT superfamily N-acetyltransferase